MRQIVVGIDGGGTKTRLAAVDAADGRRVAAAECGSIHTLFCAEAAAGETLTQGLAALALQADDRLLAVAIGDPALDDTVPGAGETLRRRAQAWAGEGVPCWSHSDVFMALYALSRGCPAALTVAGTGSMGVALTKPFSPGQTPALQVVGGWGKPTDDPGSGYWIAVEGVRAAMNAFDGVAPPTALCGEATAFFAVHTPRDLIDRFNGGGLDRAKIAAFSRRVAACAAGGDPAAVDVLRRAGQALGDYACALLAKLPGPAPLLGVSGSVLLYNAAVRAALDERVGTRYPAAVIRPPAVPPEIGAALYAADRLGLKGVEYRE